MHTQPFSQHWGLWSCLLSEPGSGLTFSQSRASDNATSPSSCKGGCRCWSGLTVVQAAIPTLRSSNQGEPASAVPDAVSLQLLGSRHAGLSNLKLGPLPQPDSDSDSKGRMTLYTRQRDWWVWMVGRHAASPCSQMQRVGISMQWLPVITEDPHQRNAMFSARWAEGPRPCSGRLSTRVRRRPGLATANGAMAPRERGRSTRDSLSEGANCVARGSADSNSTSPACMVVATEPRLGWRGRPHPGSLPRVNTHTHAPCSCSGWLAAQQQLL
eukprot:360178-Chlamydomonas_euryale.AAC.7